jgi:hypothetical protein
MDEIVLFFLLFVKIQGIFILKQFHIVELLQVLYYCNRLRFQKYIAKASNNFHVSQRTTFLQVY